MSAWAHGRVTGELTAALVAGEEAVIRAITRSHDERQKLLTSQMAALGVSADQLRAAVRVCGAALEGACPPVVCVRVSPWISVRVCVCADGGPLKLARAYECGMRVSVLCGAGTAPCVRPELEARMNDGMKAGLGRARRLMSPAEAATQEAMVCPCLL